MTDPTLATWSDWTYAGAMVVYVLALVLHGVQFAGRRRAPAGVAATSPPVAAAAAESGAESAAESGGTTTTTATTATAVADPPPGPLGTAAGTAAAHDPADVAADGPAPSRAARFGRMAVSLTVLGFLLHAASIVLRGVATERWPLGNMYEFSSAICVVAVGSWLVMLQRHRTIARLGVFVLLPVVLLMFLAGTLLYTQAGPLTPPLRSYWITIHVSSAVISSGMLMVSGAAAIGYLLRTAHADRGRFARMAQRLPATDVLDRLSYRTAIAAFPVYTFMLITGAIWAETAWGRYWGWDPKETVALVAWIVYAGYLHARATAGWRRGAAWVNVVGFAMIVFNFFFVNLVVSGLHSYAGVG